MYRKLQQGQTLSMAMESEGKAFPELMINMYRTGESSGQMEKVAMTMALQYEKDDHIKRKIRNAMIIRLSVMCNRFCYHCCIYLDYSKLPFECV